MLSTPLLKWYLEHGLVISEVFEIVQYKPVTPFREFGENIANCRRQGDKDPSKKVEGEAAKLIGNSAHGRTLMDVSRHQEVVICDQKTTDDLVGNKRFVNFEALAPDCYEVHMNT